jgi:hypothetical protein
MKVYHAPEPVDWANGIKKVFLAGSIDNGSAIDWQAELIAQLESRQVAIEVLNPRRLQWDSTWETTTDNPLFVEQVSWELKGLEKVEYHVFYFAPQTLAPISLLELGLHGRRGTTLVCCPTGYWRKGNVDIVCKRYGVRQVETLEDLARVLANLVSELSEDKNFEVYSDQWGESWLTIRTDGTVTNYFFDRKENQESSAYQGTWQEFMENHINSSDVTFQKVAQFIKDFL